MKTAGHGRAGVLVAICASALMAWALVAGRAPTALATPAAAGEDVDEIIETMTLDEKVAQLIVVACRTWEGEDLTDLTAAPGLAEALRAHQYGGVILYGANVEELAQTADLVADLQDNNARANATTHVGYLVAADAEGGGVNRLGFGTRMVGSMATGATSNAATNAHHTGSILASELASLGINCDFAPSVDVNANPANPVIGTRSFGDDPQAVGTLGIEFGRGAREQGAICCYKHFPGHGDTGTDSHFNLPFVDKSYDELEASDLVPFRMAIEGGAEMLMTAHIALPAIDDPVTFPDGSEGYLPATMSSKILTGILREELGFEGVVVTDALEMGAVADGGLVPGAEKSAEYAANVAERCIMAGCDILLLPRDLNSAEAAAWYEDYLALIEHKVRTGAIPESRIDESLRRVLSLKATYNILNTTPMSASQRAARVETASAIVGSPEHHAIERELAHESVTLVRNAGRTLPLRASGKNVVIVSRDADDAALIEYGIKELIAKGAIGEGTRVVNLEKPDATQPTKDGTGTITIGHYAEGSGSELALSEGLMRAVGSADAVLCVSRMANLSALQTTAVPYQAISQIMEKAHKAGAKFVLLSGNLPYDAARYQGSDAILCYYMSAGMGTDPTHDPVRPGAINQNTLAALDVAFGASEPMGHLPVAIPAIRTASDGSVEFDTSKTLYVRGFGLSYTARITIH